MGAPSVARFVGKLVRIELRLVVSKMSSEVELGRDRRAGSGLLGKVVFCLALSELCKKIDPSCSTSDSVSEGKLRDEDRNTGR